MSGNCGSHNYLKNGPPNASVQVMCMCDSVLSLGSIRPVDMPLRSEMGVTLQGMFTGVSRIKSATISADFAVDLSWKRIRGKISTNWCGFYSSDPQQFRPLRMYPESCL